MTEQLAEILPSHPRFRHPDWFDLAAFWADWQQEFARSLPVVRVSVQARAGCALYQAGQDRG